MPATLTTKTNLTPDEIVQKIRNSEPASDDQLAYIARMEERAIRTDDDRYAFEEKLARHLGFIDDQGYADTDTARRVCESIRRDRISRYEASRWLDVLQGMATESRCPGCEERGVRHPSVHLYDDVYERSCRLS